jgi:photosystem II stability/assembly factor-like uncharacterized protein
MATKKRSVKRAQPKSRAASAKAGLTRRQLLAGGAAAGAAAALPKAAAGAQLTAKPPNAKRKQPRDLSEADRPDQRHYELIQDRRVGSEGKNLAQLRLNALREKAAAVARRSGTTVSPLSLGANNWVQLGPTVIPNGQTPSALTDGTRVNVTGRITGIVVDPGTPSTIYVATGGGGVWKTVDGGVTWSPKSDNEASLAIGALAMAPSNPNRLYAGTGEGSIFYFAQNRPLTSTNEDYYGVGVLRSSDGGNTWAHVGYAALTGAAFYRIAVHPTNSDVLFGATTKGLMRSQDGGATWTAITSGLPALSASVISCTDIVYDPINANRAWCAFWGSGIYRTDDANAVTPTWTQLTGLPAASISRIALAVAPSNHDVIFALIADSPVTTPPTSPRNVSAHRSIDGGNTWSIVTTTAATTPPINIQGSYTLNIVADVSTPDVVYVCARELYKCVQNGSAWTVTDIGARIHVDNHAFASHPTDNMQVYAGTDGGIYKSTNGGEPTGGGSSSWDDTINKGLAITQFEFISQHPSSDALVIGGTQDNGTEMFRNSLVFYHSADFDGGQAGIDPANPSNVIHTFSQLPPKVGERGIERSVAAGKFGTYSDISSGLSPPVLFFPPWTYDDTNSNNIAFGTDKLRLSATQGLSWPTSITLPLFVGGLVSAIHYVNSSLIYCGTTNGLVYKAVYSGGAWTATQVSTSQLPVRWIWDIFLVPGMTDVLVLAMAGYGTGHVWKGTLSGANWTWSDLSGTSPNRLPDAPANALEIDPTAPNTMYVGTDVGVWVTTDGGANWSPFNDGLPNVDVYDLKLHAPTRLLRAATHGRGLWERQLDVASVPDVRLVMRDHIMDTGRLTPSPSGLASAWEDPYRQVNLGDPLFWWNCADVKVDSPVGGSYQMPVASVDYVAFETALEHRNPQRGALNRVYVQVQNRGVLPASNVVVKILYADATPGLPDLPSDFWTAFPGNSGMPGPWTPIGAAQTIASLRPEHPAVLEWDWTPPMSAAAHSCLLVVTTSSEDSPGVTSLVLDQLVTQNRQVGLKNLHIIDVLPLVSWDVIRFYPRAATDTFRFGALPKGWSLRLILPKEVPPSAITHAGLEAKPISAAEQKRINKLLGKQAALYDLEKALVATASREGCTLTGVPVGEQGIQILVAFTAGARSSTGSVQLIQESRDQRVLGGNTFVLRGFKTMLGRSS